MFGTAVCNGHRWKWIVAVEEVDKHSCAKRASERNSMDLPFPWTVPDLSMCGRIISNHEGTRTEPKAQCAAASTEGFVYLLCGGSRTRWVWKATRGSDGTLKGPSQEWKLTSAPAPGTGQGRFASAFSRSRYGLCWIDRRNRRVDIGRLWIRQSVVTEVPPPCQAHDSEVSTAVRYVICFVCGRIYAAYFTFWFFLGVGGGVLWSSQIK